MHIRYIIPFIILASTLLSKDSPGLAPAVIPLPPPVSPQGSPAEINSQPPVAPRVVQNSNRVGPSVKKDDQVKPLDGEIIARLSDGKDISFNFSNARLFDIIQQVARLASMNYTIDPSLKDGPVRLYMNGKLEKDSLEDVLGLALKLYGVAVVKNGDFLEFVPIQASKQATPLILGNQPVDAIGNSFVVTQIIPLQFIDVDTFGSFVKEFASQNGKILPDKARNLLIINDYMVNVRRILALATLMDKQPFRQKSLALFRMKNNSPDSILKDLESILKAADVPIGTSALQILPLQSLNSLLIVTKNGDLISDIQGWIERLDERVQSEGGELFVLPLRHAKVDVLYPVLTQVLRLQASQASVTSPAQVNVNSSSFLSKPFGQPSYSGGLGLSSVGSGTAGIQALSPSVIQAQTTSVTPSVQPVSDRAPQRSGGPLSQGASVTMDTSNNALLIFGSRKDYTLIEDAVQKLDLLPRQVLIEATILDLSLTGDFEFGLSGYLRKHYNQSDINVNGAPLGSDTRDWRIDRPSSTGAFTYTLMSATQNGLLQLILNAKDSQKNTKVISQPRLWALDNQAAHLQVQDQIPIPVNTYVPGTGNGTGSNGYSITNAQYLETGLSLTVTPHINGSGVIRLEVQQEISSSTQTDTLGSGQNQIQAPRISRRSLSTELIAQNGETIVLGGLIIQNNSESHDGLPLLNRIPIIRNLFSSQSRTTQRSELVILLRPQVVRSPEEVDLVTREMKDQVDRYIEKK